MKTKYSKEFRVEVLEYYKLNQTEQKLQNILTSPKLLWLIGYTPIKTTISTNT